MANEPIVHVVDDDPAIRDSLAFLLDTADLVSRTYESAAAMLAEAHGGRIWVEPNPGGGTRFCFTLRSVGEEELYDGE